MLLAQPDDPGVMDSRSYDQPSQEQAGFESAGVVTFDVALSRTAYPDLVQVSAFYDQLLAYIRAVPGVRFVGGISGIPLRGTGS